MKSHEFRSLDSFWTRYEMTAEKLRETSTRGFSPLMLATWTKGDFEAGFFLGALLFCEETNCWIWENRDTVG